MDIAVRAIVLYFFVYLLLRVTGRRELSSLEPFDLVLLIVLGDLVQQGLTQDDFTVTGAIIAVSTIATMQVITSYTSFKFRWARRVPMRRRRTGWWTATCACTGWRASTCRTRARFPARSA